MYDTLVFYDFILNYRNYDRSMHHPPCPAVLATVIHSRDTEYPLPLASCRSFWMRSSRTSMVWTPAWTCETLWRMVKGSPRSSLNSCYRHRSNKYSHFDRIQLMLGKLMLIFLITKIKHWSPGKKRAKTFFNKENYNILYVLNDCGDCSGYHLWNCLTNFIKS